MFGFGRKVSPAPRPRRLDLEVNGRNLPLAIRENSRATRITLRIEPGGQSLRLTVPPGLPEGEINSFLTRHHGWLMTKLARLPADAEIANNAMIPIRGINHRILLTGKLRGLAETGIDNGQPALFVSGTPEHTARRVADYLKREAKRDLEAAVAVHAANLGRSVRSIAYKDTKSRWGSCSSEGNLSFSWRIAMAPPYVIDYLAAHEVAHLKEMNHGPKFWAACRMLCPRTDEAKRWLKQHGSRLQAWKF